MLHHVPSGGNHPDQNLSLVGDYAVDLARSDHAIEKIRVQRPSVPGQTSRHYSRYTSFSTLLILTLHYYYRMIAISAGY